MQKEDNKVDFDLSMLSLDELIKVYEEVKKFKQFLSDSIIEEKEKEDNE